MRRSFGAPAALWLGALSFTVSCESPVAYYAESDDYYSVFGFLDASLDTQWVRVKLLQDSLLTRSGPLDATMTMTTLHSGGAVNWNDSIFTVIDGAQVHNFWVTEPVEPLASYRLYITRSDGAASSTTVTLPDTFEEPAFSDPPFTMSPFGTSCIPTVRMVAPVETLASAEIVYHVPTTQGGEIEHRVDYVDSATFFEGTSRVTFRWVEDLSILAATRSDVDLGSIVATRAIHVRVAAAGPNWPDFSLPDETLFLPTADTYVENGLGFVGGVVSRRVVLPLGDYRSSACF